MDWTKREIQKLIKHYPLTDNEDLVKLLGRSFSAIRTKAQKLGLKKLKHSGSPFTPEKKALLFKLYPNTLNREIAKRLGVTECSIIAAGFRYKLRKTPEFRRKHSEKGMFKKGQEPVNKGKRMADYLDEETIAKIKKTQFKKGQEPVNYRPVGSERLSKDGYIEVKTKDPNEWELKHRVIYRQHFFKIPRGYNVEFKDRNKQNLDPSNLILRTRKENMSLNTYHNYPKEIANTIQLLGALQRQINKRIKQTP